MLFAIGPEHVEPGALWEDLKAEIELGIKHRELWERIAVDTDIDWLWRAFSLFALDGPRQAAPLHESEIDQAKAWRAA